MRNKELLVEVADEHFKDNGTLRVLKQVGIFNYVDMKICSVYRKDVNIVLEVRESLPGEDVELLDYSLQELNELLLDGDIEGNIILVDIGDNNKQYDEVIMGDKGITERVIYLEINAYS